MAALRLIVGLGNPGAEYLRTRHNAGFWFIDALAQREGARFGNETKLHGETAKITLDGQPLWLLKPKTFVNKSGIAELLAAALLEDRSRRNAGRATSWTCRLARPG
jgi:PTH1 family peptidyl-tRNA hydrolase